MCYLPHTDDDIREMLDAAGVTSLDGLFEAIPPAARRERSLDLPPPMDEWALTRRVTELADQCGTGWQVFLGAGSQAHVIPALVPYLAGRSEFLTSYTPYQPEVSQGTLQAIFEFQTLISRLVGLEVTNASMYDGATAMAEAALMAQRITKKRAIVVSSLVHPHWREVLSTYMAALNDVRIVTLPAGPDGRTDLRPLEAVAEPAVLIMQSPNFFGFIEDLPQASEMIHARQALLAAGFSEPFAFGLIKAPGCQGADIVFGEGQSLGLAQSFGGPSLGLLSCKKAYMRQIPGRLVGQSNDVRGQRAFVLTLATREQHIRRGKAVSNICSNAGHCALTAAIFMAAIGGSGFRRMAQLNFDLAQYLKDGLLKIGFQSLSAVPVFNEFVLKAPPGFKEKHEVLKKKKILAGLPLRTWYQGYDDLWLFGITESRTRADIDAFLSEVAQ